jgi:hypothetical protein
MRRIIYSIALILILAGCISKGVPATIEPTSTTEVLVAPTIRTYVDVFEVKAWVDNPNPEREDQIMLSGSLIKNGTYLGGMMMTASWPDENQEPGVPNCKVLVIYARGICTIDVSDYPSGVTVPITVSFPYAGHYYTETTSFTPR